MEMPVLTAKAGAHANQRRPNTHCVRKVMSGKPYHKMAPRRQGIDSARTVGNARRLGTVLASREPRRIFFASTLAHSPFAPGELREATPSHGGGAAPVRDTRMAQHRPV